MTRRDELVLKRLRSTAAGDPAILAGLTLNHFLAVAMVAWAAWLVVQGLRRRSIADGVLAWLAVDLEDYAIVAHIRDRGDDVAQVRDGAIFYPDGRTVYDKHTPDTFRAVVKEAVHRMRRSVYKRLQGPPIVAFRERAFGFDLRESIINGWVD